MNRLVPTDLPVDKTLVSVVVPFGGDGIDQLHEQLMAVERSAIDAKTRNGINCEIVISVNGASQDHLQNIETMVTSLQTPSIVIDSSSVRGPSHARNEGAWAARGSMLLFCDADDLVSALWVSELAFALTESDISGGALDLHLLNPGAVPGSPSLPSRPWNWLPFAPASNLAIRADLFRSIGGFNEDLNIGEDLDLCWRAQYTGATFNVAPKAIVHYRWRRTIRAHFSQTIEWGKGDAFLARAHRVHGLRPEYRKGAWRTARATVYLLSIPIFYRRRWHAIGAFGKAYGRVSGSLRQRIWAL